MTDLLEYLLADDHSHIKNRLLDVGNDRNRNYTKSKVKKTNFIPKEKICQLTDLIFKVSDEDKIYTVDFSSGGSYDCNSAKNKTVCKHIQIVSNHYPISCLVTRPPNDPKA